MKFNEHIEKEINSIIKENYENKYLYGTNRKIYERCIIKSLVNIDNDARYHNFGHVELINRNPFLGTTDRMKHCINDYKYISNFLKNYTGYKSVEESKNKFSADMSKVLNMYLEEESFRKDNITVSNVQESLFWKK
jgi:hypothetical protein